MRKTGLEQTLNSYTIESVCKDYKDLFFEAVKSFVRCNCIYNNVNLIFKEWRIVV
jgi:hypothetical protein